MQALDISKVSKDNSLCSPTYLHMLEDENDQFLISRFMTHSRLLPLQSVHVFSHILLFASCSVSHLPGEHLHSPGDVLVLRPGGARPPHAEVPVVEAVPHLSAAGERLLQKKKKVNRGRDDVFFVTRTDLNFSPNDFSRCSFFCSSCTPATTCSPSATSPTP